MVLMVAHIEYERTRKTANSSAVSCRDAICSCLPVSMRKKSSWKPLHRFRAPRGCKDRSERHIRKLPRRRCRTESVCHYPLPDHPWAAMESSCNPEVRSVPSLLNSAFSVDSKASIDPSSDHFDCTSSRALWLMRP
jgi:hypothetical protein